MGTRHLIAVQVDGKYRVAKYGQWDGYPSGQGTDILSFLRNQFTNAGSFRDRIARMRNIFRKAGFISEEALNALWSKYGADRNGFISLNGSDTFAADHPLLHRDTGAAVLPLIVQSVIKNGDAVTSNALDFAGDSLFCEYAYVIDLDEMVFEVFKGFQKNSGTFSTKERFSFLYDEDKEYAPVKQVASFPLSDLPTVAEFLYLLEPQD